MDNISRFLNKFKPGVRKNWLHLSAGLVWLGAGMMLIGFSTIWLRLENFSTMMLLVLTGLMLAAGIYYFGFSKLALKNINRIRGLSGERICLFAFQGWTSYPLVAFMISLGIYLRVYSPFPKSMLAILYLGIGGGLFAASLHYFAYIVRALHPNTIKVRPS
jgi:hypothetical protein